MDRFFPILADGVHRFEGTVNQYTGDGIMALFGAPIAHEDHARRACYAALHLQRRAAPLRRRAAARARPQLLGAHGHQLRARWSSARSATTCAWTTRRRATPSASRRAWSRSPSRARRTSPSTRRSSSRATSRSRDLGEFTRQGRAASRVRVYELRGRRAAAHAARRLAGARLLALRRPRRRDGSARGGARRALAGQRAGGRRRRRRRASARAASASSSLERCRARGICVLRGARRRRTARRSRTCRARAASRLLRHHRAGQRCRRRASKIAGTLLLLDEALRDDAAAGLRVPRRARSRAPGADDGPRGAAAAAVRHRAARWSRRAAEREPMVLLIEDLHWIDRGSDAFLAPLRRGGRRHARSAAASTSVPSTRGVDAASRHYQQLPLPPLGPEAIARAARRLLGTDPSLAASPTRSASAPAATRSSSRRSCSRWSRPGSSQGERGAYRLVRRSSELEMPATVQAVLAARIDRLAEREKHVLQTAAVIGKEFPESVLGASLRTPRARSHRGAWLTALL